MLPTFKECVEELFANGLCKVVFATETLALGINMPARSVVLEKLSKWNGETHADITPGEYTQLTGRAGRRGIDVEGHAVVLWQQGFDPEAVAGLASTRTYPLRSSFRPSYNMAVNLVAPGRPAPRASCSSRRSRSSRPTRRSSGWPGSCARPRRRWRATPRRRPATSATSWSTAALRRRLSDVEKRARPGASGADQRDEVVASLEALRPGDVIEVPAGKFAGMAVVDRPGHALGPRRPAALRAHRRPARAPALDGRLPGAGRGVHPDADPEDVQRPQPAVPPRPGLGAAGQHARPRRRRRAHGTGRRRRGPARRRPTASGRSPGCAPSCARTPATAAPTARTTPAGPSATTSSSATPGSCSGASSSAPTRSPGSSTGSATC